MFKLTITVILIILYATSSSFAGPQPSFDLKKIKLAVGMKRSILESNIAKYAYFKSSYSAQYPTETSTIASYTIESIVLHITYKNGSAAPYANTATGGVNHQEAIEQTVLSWGMDE